MKYELKLRPFNLPNFVLAAVPGRTEDLSIPIHELSKEALEELLKKFCDDVRAKHAAKPAVKRGGVIA